MTTDLEKDLYCNKLRANIYASLEYFTGISAELLEKFLSGSNDIDTVEYLTIAQGFCLDKKDLEI